MAGYNHVVTAGVLVEDTACGRVRAVGANTVVATYRLSDWDSDRVTRSVLLLSEALLAAGAHTVYLPFAGRGPLRNGDDLRRARSIPVATTDHKLATVHLMGTARLGTDPMNSVCDPYGAVHDTAGLSVADASLFPAPVGVNPMLTIMALATLLGRKYHRRMVSVLDQALPSADYLALVRSPSSRLVEVARRGGRPDVQALAGWEWRGTNMPGSSRLLGLRRFIKGFVAGGDGQLDGYNVSVAGSNLSSPWKDRPQRDGRRVVGPLYGGARRPGSDRQPLPAGLTARLRGRGHAGTWDCRSDTGLSRAGRARLGRVVARSGVPRPRSGFCVRSDGSPSSGWRPPALSTSSPLSRSIDPRPRCHPVAAEA